MEKRLRNFINTRRRKRANKSTNRRFKSCSDLLNWHFELIGDPGHISRTGISRVFEFLNEAPSQILETGSSAWGIDSTRLWARYVANWGGHLDSIDIREAPRQSLGYLGENVSLHCGNSLDFLDALARDVIPKYDFVYLDSFDVDWSHSVPAARHGLDEFQKLLPLIHEKTLILIDDTPSKLSEVPEAFQEDAELFRREWGVLPGKGAFILNSTDIENFEILYHGYNLLLRPLGVLGER